MPEVAAVELLRCLACVERARACLGADWCGTVDRQSRDRRRAKNGEFMQNW